MVEKIYKPLANISLLPKLNMDGVPENGVSDVPEVCEILGLGNVLGTNIRRIAMTNTRVGL